MKNKFFCLLFIVFVSLALNSRSLSQISNGSFDEVNDVNLPTNWTCSGNVDIYSTFKTQSIGYLGELDWLVSEINAIDGDYFIVISSNDQFDPPRYEREYRGDEGDSKVYQTITFTAGLKLSGYYFFGTTDAENFNDWAKIRLIDVNNSQIKINIVETNVNIVGNRSSTDGWIPFEHTFTELDAGTYILEFVVTDIGDGGYESILAVDDVRICISPSYGDLNGDCVVNFQDISTLSRYWRSNCTDPDSDPNCIADIYKDDSNSVNERDLEVLTSNWLLSEN